MRRIDVQELESAGYADLGEVMPLLAPSFNLSCTQIWDSSDLFRPEPFPAAARGGTQTFGGFRCPLRRVLRLQRGLLLPARQVQLLSCIRLKINAENAAVAERMPRPAVSPGARR